MREVKLRYEGASCTHFSSTETKNSPAFENKNIRVGSEENTEGIIKHIHFEASILAEAPEAC